jgi:ABC-type transport system substrate-binding protein
MEVKGWNVVTPSTIGYSTDLNPFPFDPEKARELLADASYPGGKGFGKLIINTWVSKSIPFLPESALLAADFWKQELGLDVEVNVGDETALKKALATDELRGQILWRDNETRLDAASNILKAYGTPGVDYQFHTNPELYEYVQEGISVIDPDQRPEALNKVYMRLLDESYELAIGYVNIPWAVGPRIETWKPYPLASHPTGLHTMTLR